MKLTLVGFAIAPFVLPFDYCVLSELDLAILHLNDIRSFGNNDAFVRPGSLLVEAGSVVFKLHHDATKAVGILRVEFTLVTRVAGLGFLVLQSAALCQGSVSGESTVAVTVAVTVTVVLKPTEVGLQMEDVTDICQLYRSRRKQSSPDTASHDDVLTLLSVAFAALSDSSRMMKAARRSMMILDVVVKTSKLCSNVSNAECTLGAAILL